MGFGKVAIGVLIVVIIIGIAMMWMESEKTMQAQQQQQGGTQQQQQQIAASEMKASATTSQDEPPAPIEVKPRPSNVVDCGYDGTRGWYDIQGQGVKNDYCRVVGDGAGAWLSCYLAGAEKRKPIPGDWNSVYWLTPPSRVIDGNLPHDPVDMSQIGCDQSEVPK